MHADPQSAKSRPLSLAERPRPWRPQPSFSTSHLSAGIVTTSQTHIRNDARPRARPPRSGQVDRLPSKLLRRFLQPLAAPLRSGGGEFEVGRLEANEGVERAQPVQGLQESFRSSVRTRYFFPEDMSGCSGIRKDIACRGTVEATHGKRRDCTMHIDALYG